MAADAVRMIRELAFDFAVAMIYVVVLWGVNWFLGDGERVPMWGYFLAIMAGLNAGQSARGNAHGR